MPHILAQISTRLDWFDFQSNSINRTGAFIACAVLACWVLVAIPPKVAVLGLVGIERRIDVLSCANAVAGSFCRIGRFICRFFVFLKNGIGKMENSRLGRGLHRGFGVFPLYRVLRAHGEHGVAAVIVGQLPG